MTTASDFAQRETSGASGSLDTGEGKPTLDPQMLLRLPGFTGVFEEAEQERDILDANSLTTASDHFRRSLSEASGNCCEQAARCMEFT